MTRRSGTKIYHHTSTSNVGVLKEEGPGHTIDGERTVEQVGVRSKSVKVENMHLPQRLELLVSKKRSGQGIVGSQKVGLILRFLLPRYHF